MIYKEIVEAVAKETSLPKSVVDRTYKAYWKVIRSHIIALPLKKDLTDEEFLRLQPNINIPSLGKLNVTLERYRNIKNIARRLNQIKKEKNYDSYKED